MAKLVEKTYGDALFQLAIENQSIDELYDEAKAVLLVLKENEDIKKLLGHPKISKEEKSDFIEKVFKGRISEDLTGFLTILVKKDRQNDMEKTFDYFIARVKEYKKIGVVSVVSAAALSEIQKSDIVEKLLSTTGYETLEMEYTVDSSLLGGMKISIGDRVVDSSIKTKLSSLSKDLYKIQLT